MVGCVVSLHQVHEGNKGWQIMLAAKVQEGLQCEGPILTSHFRGGAELDFDAMFA